MVDAFGFGAAMSMMIPAGFVPDVVDQLTDLWFLPSMIISLFFFGVFWSQMQTNKFGTREIQQSPKFIIYELNISSIYYL